MSGQRPVDDEARDERPERLDEPSADRDQDRDEDRDQDRDQDRDTRGRPHGRHEATFEADSHGAPDTAAPPPGDGRSRAWRRLRRAAQPRATRAQVLAALLIALLGFALVTQVTQRDEQRLAGLRQSDLVQILDNIGDRRDRLAAEQSDLEAERRDLTSGAAGSQAAIDAAQQRLDTLGVLAGTVAAKGTGVQVFISDPQGEVRAARILDLVQELRDAGAEAIQVGDARVVASTAFTDVPGGVAVDGDKQQAPYTVLAIGDGQTMATALEIPGGVLASLPQGARGTVATKDEVLITALRPLPTPRYAQPAITATPSR